MVEIFRRGGKATDFRWWHSQSARSIFKPLFGYQDGQLLFEEVVEGVLRLNPVMLSEYEIGRKIMYDFLMSQTTSWSEPGHLYNENLITEAKQLLKKLIEFEAWQNVDVPLANLWHEGEAIKIGQVLFTKVTKEELKQWKKGGLWTEPAPTVEVVARVRAPGDRYKARSYAITHVNLILDIIRAFCFPFGHWSDAWQVGVVGHITSSALTPMRIDNRLFVSEVGAGLAIL